MISLFKKTWSRLASFVKVYVLRDKHAINLHKFRVEYGTLRYVESWPINQASLVYDVGGYTGEWCSRIVQRYNCFVRVFEPVSEFADTLQCRFEGNPKVQVERFGLAKENRLERFVMKGDASGTSAACRGPEITVPLRAVREIIESEQRGIDLMAINIEGAEYELLEELLKYNLTAKIDNILVQFHNCVRDCEARRDIIRKSLSESHYELFSYDFVWEGWRKKRK